MSTIQRKDYPFVEEFLTDSSGKIRKVVLQLKDYHRLLESIEDQGLYNAMQVVRGEQPLSAEEALKALDDGD